MKQRLDSLAERIGQCMLVDRDPLRRRLAGLRRRLEQGKPVDRGLGELEKALAASAERLSRRRAGVPVPSYPEELPVSARRAAIAAAIEEHQVVVIAGETGSGKTTQIPKICLELGRGVNGLIAHTQPRRIAARSVAARIAEELGSPLGQAVGYKIRFADQVSDQSYIKLLTDGMLLAEVQGDRGLEQYDTIIIDEAHERSLNIDFLLGYLKRLLPKRPDLKVIVTSATINVEGFSAFFGGAPIIEVSGRTYPVEVRYRPLLTEENRERDQTEAILDAVAELGREDPLGDTLIFLSGEREIRDTADALRKRQLRDTEVLPLYSRLSAAEQDRVFKGHAGRRIVLATNVAETSLTVPGIRFVIDPGLARISRYSHRTQVQRLPIEPISQASANQRSGRCGRVSEGTAIRLYSEEDFIGRPQFTDPEILRTNLASVILQMAALSLGDPAEFPFMEPPDKRLINDGLRTLHELGAVDRQHRLTDIGRQLSRLPVDPRVGRMLLAADREGSLHEVLVIAAALSIQDPRERPLEAQQQADEAHREWRDEQSDFVAYLNLWEWFHEQARQVSRSQLRKLCQKRFVSWIRMREWQDIHAQLRTQAREMGLKQNQKPAEFIAVHRALLTGLLSNCALKADTGEAPRNEKGKRRRELPEYQGARNLKLTLFPGSALAKKPPKWVMAAELVETTRLFARTCAGIDPKWLEELGAHLLKRSWFEPHWEKRPAKVAAFEQVTLFGLVLVARRKVNYGPIDPAVSRELFIRHALVGGEFESKAAFLHHNRELVAEVEALEAKSRRRDVLVDEQYLFDFYDARLPEGIWSGAGFEKWVRSAPPAELQALRLTRDELMQHGAEGVTEAQFPDRMLVDGLELPLEYHFEPGHPADGVTAVVPLAALAQLRPEPFDWLVPGMREEKIIALIKGLPKPLRKNFVPAVNFARAVLQSTSPQDGPLLPVVARQLQRMTGTEVSPEAWSEPDPHWQMNFRVVDENGKVLAQDRSLERLRAKLAGRVRESLESHPLTDLERSGITEWDFDELPEQVAVQGGGLTLQGWPALVEHGKAVDLRILDDPAKAARASRDGVRRLFMLALPDKVKYLERKLPDLDRICLLFAPVGPCDELRADLARAVFDRVFQSDPLPRTRAAFDERLEEGRPRLITAGTEMAADVRAALEEYHHLTKALKGAVPPTVLQAAADIREQVGRLVYPGFIAATPLNWLPHLPRYLKAAQLRLEKAARDPGRDRANTLEVARLHERWEKHAERTHDPALVEYRWLLEELRVSLFAQELKTAVPVSAKRLEQRWKAIT